MAPKLIVRDTASGRAEEYPLTEARIRIGRSQGANDLVLDSFKISREHAYLERVGTGYKIVDLGSANGTFVNGERVHEKLLATNDIISLSHYTLQYRADVLRTGSFEFSERQLGRTVVLRKPEDITPALSQQDKSALLESASSQAEALSMAALMKKAETLSRLYELNRLLSSEFSLDNIFKKVSEMLFRLTPADRFFVLLKQPGADRLSPFAAHFRDATNSRPGETYSISKTVMNRVVTERVSLLSVDTSLDDRLAGAGSIIIQQIQSVMCAPLLGRKDVLGVMYLDCQRAINLFAEDDLDLLNALAAETSIAVDNAVTHEQLLKEALARAAYGRFMPPHVVDEILANPEKVQFGGSNQLVTALFSDIRGFTSMSEHRPPEVVVQILNHYFGEMSPLVFEHSGMLDKFIGDGLMALFGVPDPREDAAVQALTAAVAMQGKMAALNQYLRDQNFPEIAIGIGIHTGMATVGYIGSEERTDYTAIGDSINLAARLEKQAGAGQIIISRHTLDALGGKFPTRPAGKVTVKGRQEEVEIFEVVMN